MGHGCSSDMARPVNRRAFLYAGSAAVVTAALTPSRLYADTDDRYYTPEFLEELFEGNTEDLTPSGPSPRLTGAQYRDVLAAIERGDARAAWAADADNPDYAHLAEPVSDKVFALTAAHLEALMRANGFAMPGESMVQRLLFGLRGCRVAAASSEAFGTEIELIESVPDHFVQNCVIGAWDLASGEIAVFNASTVTDAAYMYAQATNMEGANLMPTGYYRYDVGTHGWKRQGSRQPGAWRQAAAWPVRRILTIPESRVLSYTHAAAWDVGPGCGTRATTGNNMHAGILDRSSLKTKFSSAGCQTIPGRYEPRGKQPAGAYARLRVAAGLPRTPNVKEVEGFPGATTDEDGLKYGYMLLTGREARLLATGARSVEQLQRVRYGSRGERVARVHAALTARGFGCSSFGRMFGMSSVGKLVEFQRANGLAADGMVGPDTAAKLEIS